ncbi:hypothetical protein Hanom_Chr08g00694041 [Helianthus anomalus]
MTEETPTLRNIFGLVLVYHHTNRKCIILLSLRTFYNLGVKI